MQAIRELHDDHADVGDHGEQHLTDAFRLPFLTRVHVQLAQFGDAVDATGDFIAELFAEFVERNWRVLDDIVEQASDEARHIHLLIDEQIGNRERMHEIRFAGFAGLAGVQAGGEFEGFVERRQILIGT